LYSPTKSLTFLKIISNFLFDAVSMAILVEAGCQTKGLEIIPWSWAPNQTKGLEIIPWSWAPNKRIGDYS